RIILFFEYHSLIEVSGNLYDFAPVLDCISAPLESSLSIHSYRSSSETFAAFFHLSIDHHMPSETIAPIRKSIDCFWNSSRVYKASIYYLFGVLTCVKCGVN